MFFFVRNNTKAIYEGNTFLFSSFFMILKTSVKDRAHLLRVLSAEGKIDQMLDLEAEMELRAHIWPFDSTHEYFDP